MIRQRQYIKLVHIIVFVLSVPMLVGFCPPGVGVADASVTLSQVQAASISNPRIVKDSSMDAGQKVTWDCIYFGSYPQSEVTVVDGSIYNVLKNATGWNSDNDITIGTTKYRRLKGEDAAYAIIASPGCYDWIGGFQTYHYFKYEPIKWRVLNRNGNDVLLLADVVLDDQKYNINNKDVTWQTSSIRSWLNGYDASTNEPKRDYTKKNFINIAFTPAQQKAIRTSEIVNDNNLVYKIAGGNRTSDKIFLLSESEVYNTDMAIKYGFAKEYDAFDEARRSRSSTYAHAMGVWRYECEDENESDDPKYNGNIFWWLRSMGDDSARVVEVSTSGWIFRSGGDVDSYNVGVRPALHLNLASSDLYSYAGTVCSDAMKSGESDSDSPMNPEIPDNPQQPAKKIKVSSIRLSAISKQIAAGKKVTLRPTVLPANASNKKITWKSSNSKVATVTQSGVVTLKKKTGGKKVTITATAADGSKKSASWKITSMKGIVKKIKITGSKSVKAGKKLKLKAKVTATKKANTKLRWTSSNTKYATVNAKGIVTTKKIAKGKTVKITAMATDGSGKKQSVKIKIKK